jgi:hypothetical protein
VKRHNGGLAGWDRLSIPGILMSKLIIMNLSNSDETEKIHWDGSQADFITLVEFFEATGAFQSDGELATVDDIGELFMNVIDIDISPFTDFHTMRISVAASRSPQEVAKLVLNKLDEEEHFSDALVGTGVAPSPEEQASNITSWIFASDFVTKLGEYIDFTEKK